MQARKLNFRPRPIDIYKKLDIIKTKKGIQLDDDVERGIPSMPSGMESDEEEVRLLRSLYDLEWR